MDKIHFFILSLIITQTTCAQNLTAFSDLNGKLYEFNSGQISMVEFQQTKSLLIGNKYLAYSDSKDDYWVRWNGKKMLLAQGQTEFYETDNILVAHFTSILKIVEDGEVKTLTNFVQNFGYGDSLVVFQDKIGGNLKYYYQDTIVEFAQIIGNYIFSPNQIGKNVFAYGDNAGNYYAFYNHQFYPLFSSNTIPEFSSGLNIVAFNDYENNTFSIFRKEEIIDIESQHVLKYETGNDFVYYQDQSETNRVYYQEESMDLGYDLENLTVSDSTVTYFDGGYLNIWFDNEIYTIYNSPGTNAQIDGGIVAYSNKNGGVSAFVRGEEIEITRQRVSSFWLNGNTIVLQFSPSSYAVWWNGELFRF